MINDKLMAKMATECLIISKENQVIKAAMNLSKQKGNLKWLGRVPLSAVTVHPEAKKYFDPAIDNVKDRETETMKFLKRFSGDCNNFDMRKP